MQMKATPVSDPSHAMSVPRERADKGVALVRIVQLLRQSLAEIHGVRGTDAARLTSIRAMGPT